MEHGKVTTTKYEDGVVYCMVSPVRTQTEYGPVPIMKPHSGFHQLPKQGDTVAMQKLSDGTRFISDVISKVDESPDSMKEGELVIQLDEETKVEFRKQGDGTFNLNLSASGDVTIDGIDFDEHTHDYTWDDAAGSDTTDGPQ